MNARAPPDARDLRTGAFGAHLDPKLLPSERHPPLTLKMRLALR